MELNYVIKYNEIFQKFLFNELFLQTMSFTINLPLYICSSNKNIIIYRTILNLNLASNLFFSFYYMNLKTLRD